MKDQPITILEAMRLAQDMLEVEGHTQETLAELRSILCNEDVIDAARALSFVDSPATAPQDGVPFPRDRRERLRSRLKPARLSTCLRDKDARVRRQEHRRSLDVDVDKS
jgi:hypothetical protein